MSDLSRKEILSAIEAEEELPEEVKECEKSVREDNPDLSKSEAIAICRDQLDMSDAGGCPEGEIHVNGQCIPTEEVDGIPPSSLDMSAPRVLTSRRLAGPIKREELSDGKVRYKNVALLDRGVWTDAGSGKPTEYDPAELEVADDAPVNIMHDAESDASQAGYIEADSWTVEHGTGYANVVLDLSKSAGQYADDTLQETLETGGEVGFGGPSIEIPPQGYDLEQTAHGYPKLVDGVIEGMGFVRDPASKSTSFARQTAERGVAMSAAGGQNPMVFTPKRGSMSDGTRERILTEVLGRELQMEEIQDDAEAIADELDVPVGEVMEVLDPLLDMDGEEPEEEEGVENEEEEDDDPEEGDGDDPEEGEEEENDDDAPDMEALESEIAELRSDLEAMREAMMEAEEVETELAEVREELAAAETVQELAEEKDDLEKRLAAVEDTSKKPKTLSGATAEDSDDFEPTYDTTPSEPAGW